MDHPLKPSLTPVDLARTLLTTSSAFEPFVPGSQQDVFKALNLLGTLGELTEKSFHRAEEPAQKPSLAAKVSSPPSQPGRHQSLKNQNRLNDQQILEALNKLRESETFRKRSSGIFSTIIRHSTRLS